MEIYTQNEAQTRAAAADLARQLSPGDVVLVSGELGAGKTAFVRGALRALGVTAPVTSPTFTIGQLYQGDIEIAHLDLYRIASLTDEDPALLDDYLASERIVFVEWPEAGEGVLPEAHTRVHITSEGQDQRILHIE
jgi:tRNA threonylcarbamoyladenosine biosynthesis protein TsaE